MALVGITAHLGLFRDAQLKMGEKVFVHGGSGGVGSCVVQMARAVGARVMTTAGSDEKVQICRQLGANVGGQLQDRQRGRRRCDKFGPIDVWWENLREPDLERRSDTWPCAAGSSSWPAATPGRRSPSARSTRKDCSLLGFAMFNAPADEQRKAAAEINRWLAKGRLRPQIDRVMQLSETAAAHRCRKRTRSTEGHADGQDRAGAVRQVE